MTRKYFGTDGIRGRMGQEPITPERVLKLGWAAGRVLGRGHDDAKIVIGKDTRISGYLLESALQAGIAAAGVNVRLLGPMPTPAIAYMARTSRASAGIVISASHNLYEDNGIKFFSHTGSKLSDEVELEIEKLMDQELKTVPSEELGNARRYSDAPGRYIEFCKSTFPSRRSLEGLKIVVDCANGAAYHIAPSVFIELGAQVIPIANNPDGFNINDASGSTDPGALQERVKSEQADLGIALDGDADRVILVDAKGDIVDGDQILYAIAMEKKRNQKAVGGVVGTLMTNLGLEQALKKNDIPFRRANVGDRYVMNELKQLDWELGGESSGHIICLDMTTTGDGIIAALQVLAAMVLEQKSLKDLVAGMDIYPQILINVRTEAKIDIENNSLIKSAVSDAESELADSGRVLLRASGTEPVIRVMVEGSDSGQVERVSEGLAQVVRQAAAD